MPTRKNSLLLSAWGILHIQPLTESDTLGSSGVTKADKDFESDGDKIQEVRNIFKYEDDGFNIFITDDPQFQDN